MSATWEIRQGDCVEAMVAMGEATVDAIVTDPPYGLEFMGKEWDRLGATADEFCESLDENGQVDYHGKGNAPFGGGGKRVRYGSSARSMQEWHEAWAREALRVLKPGGHLLAFGGTRTYHRLACAIEDAGFEIRDTIARLHTKVSKPIDILTAWREWSETASNAGVRFARSPTEAGTSTPASGSAPAPVLLATSLERSPADALIAEMSSSEAHRTDAGSWRSALGDAAATTTGSSALVTIAESPPASRDPASSTGSTAPNGAPAWLDASMEARTKAVEALRIWRGSEPSSKRAATDALCAALTDALKAITCAQSKTFQGYDTTLRTVCVSATTVTTTASTAALLISSTVDTLARRGGDAKEAPGGPLAWVYGSGFP